MVGYIAAISLMKDVRRVFMYHGAEHMSIHAYEHDDPLTVECARVYPTLHPRCGTAFLLLVLIISIGLFAAIFPLLPKPNWPSWLANLFFIGIKMPLMAPIAGAAYEVTRYAGKHSDEAWLKPIIWPGLMLQKLTTRKPTDDQLEVALTALKRALARELGKTDRRRSRPRGNQPRESRDRGLRPDRGRVRLMAESEFKEKLDGIEARFDELERQLADPAVVSDQNLYRPLAKEHSELSDLVGAIKKFKQADADIEANAELLEDDDPEMRQMAEEDIEKLRAEMDELVERIKFLLLPKDPNDDRNVLIEVRAGTGAEKPPCSRPTCSGCTAVTPKPKVGKLRSFQPTKPTPAGSRKWSP